MNKFFRFLCTAICLGSLCGSVYCCYSFFSVRTGILEQKKTELMKTTQRATRLLDFQLKAIARDVNSVAKHLSRSSSDFSNGETRLRQLVQKHAMISSAVIAFEPYAYRNDMRLHAPFFRRNGTKITEAPLGYDYTDSSEESRWYTACLKNGAHWQEPFWGKSTKKMIVAYTAPFNANDKTAGVILVSVSLDKIARTIQLLDLGPGGFGALVSEGGRYIYHPNQKYVTDGKTLEEIGREKNDRTRLEMWQLRGKNKAGIRDHVSTTTGLKSLFIYAPVNTTRWMIHNTFILRDLELNNQRLRHHLYCAIIVFCVFFVFFLFCLLLFFSTSTTAIWTYSTLLAVVLLSAIISVWYFALEYSSHKQTTENIIYNDSRSRQVEKLFRYRHTQIDRNKSLYTVPAGVYLNSIKFSDKTTISVNGVAWLKYNKHLPSDITKEISFPNAVVRSLEKAEQREIDNYTLVKWHFEADIIKPFDLSRYPLEYEQVALQIKHNDPAYKVLLIPDMASYRVTAPTSLPCISKSLAIPGWRIVESYFSVNIEDDKPGFGESNSYLTTFQPMLQFNFTIHRKFIDVFVANLTPILLVLFLLFVGLMVSNVGTAHAGKFKSDDLPKLISFCSGLLFIVVFTHIGIREKVDAEKLFLLEYFYLVSYFAFFYIIVNIILFKAEIQTAAVSYRNNLLYKVLFWPIIYVTILTVSLTTFY